MKILGEVMLNFLVRSASLWNPASAASPRQPVFELLEERILLAAQPIVTVIGEDGGTISNGSEDVLIGDTAHITLRFDNVPDGPGDGVGYAPYIDIILPTNGADGAGVGPDGDDGVTFQGATYLGLQLQATQIEFDANGQAVHPFAKDQNGNARILTGTPGSTLVVLTLPFGSFTGDQTPADIVLELGLSNLADRGVPLNIQAQGGFAFGGDPLNNPTTDHPILGPTTGFDINPIIASLTKIYDGPEQETATGPSYPHSWTITPKLAPGQTVTDFVLTDTLPDGVVVTGWEILNGFTGTVTQNGNVITAVIDGAVVGGGTMPGLRIDFYVAENHSGGAVLDPVTGAPRALENNARLDFTWTPLDARDPTENVTIDPEGPENVIYAKSVALQKSVTVVGGGTPGPGSQLEWVIEGQVSDYFAIDNLVVTDVLSDGQRFLDSFSPTIVIVENGVQIFTGALLAGQYAY
nr:hypothetical protein [uncultured Roseococcus sp.]